MSVFSPSGVAPLSSISLQGGQSPFIQNISVALANTEVVISLPATTKRFRVRNRNNSVVKLAYTLGDSGTTYLTIYPGGEYQEAELTLPSGLDVYVQTTQPSQTLEVVSWT